MQPAEDSWIVVCDEEDSESLQVQVTIEHGYEMLPGATKTLSDRSLRGVYCGM